MKTLKRDSKKTYKSIISNVVIVEEKIVKRTFVPEYVDSTVLSIQFTEMQA